MRLRRKRKRRKQEKKKKKKNKKKKKKKKEKKRRPYMKSSTKSPLTDFSDEKKSIGPLIVS